MGKCQICGEYSECVKAVGGRMYCLCFNHRIALDNFLWNNHPSNFNEYDKTKLKLEILKNIYGRGLISNLDPIDTCWNTFIEQEKVFRQIVDDWVVLQIRGNSVE